MLFLSLLANVLAFFPLPGLGWPTTDSVSLGPSNALCTRSYHAVTATSTNTLFSNISAADLKNPSQPFLTSLQQTFDAEFPTESNFTRQFLAGGQRNVTRTYNISGTLCVPKSGQKDKNTVQFLIHGIGYDSRYWDFSGSGVPNNHSYVRAGAEAGYATFRYDRLGTGLSEKPEDAFKYVDISSLFG
jgi:hypothetical protein